MAVIIVSPPTVPMSTTRWYTLVIIYTVLVYSNTCSMVDFNTDPLDGPEVDTSDAVGSVKGMAMYVLGAGVFFALLATAQSTVTPVVQNLFDALPGVNSGGSGSGMIRFGNPED